MRKVMIAIACLFMTMLCYGQSKSVKSKIGFGVDVFPVISFLATGEPNFNKFELNCRREQGRDIFKLGVNINKGYYNRYRFYRSFHKPNDTLKESFETYGHEARTYELLAAYLYKISIKSFEMGLGLEGGLDFISTDFTAYRIDYNNQIITPSYSGPKRYFLGQPTTNPMHYAIRLSPMLEIKASLAERLKLYTYFSINWLKEFGSAVYHDGSNYKKVDLGAPAARFIFNNPGGFFNGVSIVYFIN